MTHYRIRINILMAAMVTLMAVATMAEESDENVPLINSLVGTWQGSGTLFGSQASFGMQWEWVLDSQFVRLTFENKMSRADGDVPVLKAQAFYQPEGDGKYEGTWFDTRGMVLPLKAIVEDSALVTLWGSPETEQGKTVYRLVHRDSIEVEDFVLKNGDWKSFGNASYRRTDSE